MPRNSSGTYSLPQGAFSPNTLIVSAAVNSNFSDIATAITQSLATTGVSTMTGPFKAVAGSVGAPGITFGSSPTSGFWLNGATQIGWAAAGVQGALFNSDLSVTWAGGATWAGNVSFGGTASITGNTTIGGTLGLTGGFTGTTGTATGVFAFTSTDHIAIPSGTTAQRPASPAASFTRFNTDTGFPEFYNGTIWISPGKAMTIQKLTSGTTYSTPTGVAWIKVRAVGGGGGGGGAGTSAGAATAGGTTTFNSVNAAGGTNGNNNVAGTGGGGGAGGTGGTGSATIRFPGESGDGAPNTSVNPGGSGGASFYFGGRGNGVVGATGGAGVTNTGGGGSGGSGGSGVAPAGGGGAGEYFELVIQSPAATYTYAIGAGGTGGSAGTGGSGQAGGAGAAGCILVEEYYS